MPFSPPVACSCPTLPCTGACKKPRIHQQQRYDVLRGTAAQRGYDRAWRAFVHAFRLGYDLDPQDAQWVAKVMARNRCSIPGCYQTTALQYDHITALKDGGARLDPANVQALCHRHHCMKTSLETKGRGM